MGYKILTSNLATNNGALCEATKAARMKMRLSEI